MVMSDKKYNSGAKPQPNTACAKAAILGEFIKEYGEGASWEDWLTFLEERPELKGFEWARNRAGRRAS